MKKYIYQALTAFTLLSANYAIAQNTFPSTGTVGIGTTTPNANVLLEIKKDAPSALGPVLRLTGGGFAGGQVAIDLATYDPGGALLPASRIVASDNNFGCSLDFQTKQMGANTNPLQSRLFISSTGNVGIGTNNVNDPNCRLFVETGIRTRKVVVDQAAWPDFVFHPSYNLRPLKEIEQYIHQNHHLPEVVSEATVKKEGLDLGDNQAALLKKVEELTLYLIEQNKKMEQMQHEIDQLKKQR